MKDKANKKSLPQTSKKEQKNPNLKKKKLTPLKDK